MQGSISVNPAAKTIEDAGGHLLRWTRQSENRISIVWRIGNQTVHSLINNNFRILDAGYCLSGEDKHHSVSSLISLAGIFQKEEGSLYITRE